MSSSNSSISLVGLDPDTQKASLRAFLQSQDIFRDYDFTGSNLSALVDVLAADAFKYAFYLNMVFSEGQLDAAQMRKNVVSRAKELNYTPRSARSSRAVVRLDFTANTPSAVIPKGTTFTGRAGQRTLNFVTDSTVVTTSPNGTFRVDDLELYEGTFLQDSFVVDHDDEARRFVLSSRSIDVDSLVVVSQEDDGATAVQYSRATTLLGMTGATKSYFLQAYGDDRYEVVFGDGVCGRRPKDGAIVQVQYRVTIGADGDGTKSFVLNDDFTGGRLVGQVRVTATTPAQDGASAESTESIRFYAPRHFQIQERAVVTSDYEILLRTQFPEIAAVSVFGGEELDPPRYGRVYVAVDIEGVDGLPEAKKTQYGEFLRGRAGVTLYPVFVEPEHVYVRVDSTVRYDVNLTTIRPQDVETLVAAAVGTYASTNLDDFKSTLRYSRLVAAIDQAHGAIVSNETEVRVYKRVVPTTGVAQNVDVKFEIPLLGDLPALADSHPEGEEKCVSSSPFVYAGAPAELEDDGAGTIRVVKLDGGVYSRIVDVGTVDYATGLVKLTNFRPDSFDGGAIRVYARPAGKDFSSSKNVIMSLEDDEVHVVVEAIRE